MLKFLHQDQWFTASILVLGVLLLTISGALLRFDYVFYDIGQYLSKNDVPDDVVLVVVDEPSLDQLGKWPWTRETHAQLIRQISRSEPKVVGFDILFSEPDQLHPKDDLALVNALSASKRVVLPVIIESPFAGAPITANHSLASFAQQAAGIGRVNVPLDGDGIARGVYLWEGVAQVTGQVDWFPHFAQAVLAVAKELPSTYKPRSLRKESNGAQSLQMQYRKIDFSAPASHFPQVSYVDVWAGRVHPSYFEDKIVLVGATAIGMGDFVATPMSSFSSPMSGLEFNANVITAMRGGKLIRDIPLWLNGLVSMLLVMLPILWLSNLTPLKSLLYILAYMLVIIVVAISLPSTLHFWFKPSSLLMMVLLAYPIWSWRRLEQAHAHLNIELQQLKTDLTEFGLQADEVVAETTSKLRDDLLQSRISQVRYASQLLRDLQHKKNETLAFISHDLRMPLATAMMMLNEQNFAQKKDRVLVMLEQANELAENFLSISKAETLNNTAFKEVELSGLVQEAVDHIYQLARSKQVKVKLHLPEAPAWVMGDFTLLHRACVNLLTNAIKFSHEGGLVEVKLSSDGAFANIEVKDYGEGIAPDKLEQIFIKFKRLEGQPVMQGSGLGLYFVDVTTQKHGGEVTVKSKLKRWSAFTISLPVLHFDEDGD